VKYRFIVFALLCFATASVTFASNETLTGSEKEKQLFSQIESSAYGSRLPAMISPTRWSRTSLLSASYNAKTFSHQGDVMPKGRQKLIHSFGSVALVSFMPILNHAYTGLLSAGAPHAMIRVSLESPLSNDAEPSLTPGLAIKFFIDNKPSVNILAKPSLDGQTKPNIFEYAYTTDLPKPSWSIATWVQEYRFSSALSYVGQGGGNQRALSIDEMANQTSMGEEVLSPVVPFALEFVATADLKALGDIKHGQDFRVALEGKGLDIVLFEVYAKSSEEGAPFLIGHVVGRSNFIASSVGDNKLFFRHPPVHMPMPVERDDF
jgi:hypothetical protein